MIAPESCITTAEGNLRRLLSGHRKNPPTSEQPLLVSTTTAVATMDPLLVFEQACGQERMFWERAMDRFALVAIGEAVRLTGEGDARCSQVAQAWRRLRSGAVVETPDGYPLCAPVCLGGLAFDAGRRRDPDWADYPDAMLFLPRLLFTWSGESCWLTINALATPDSGTERLLAETAAMLSTLLARQADGRGGEAPGVVRRDEPGPAGEHRHETTPAAEGPDAKRRWEQLVSAIVEDIRGGTVEKQVLARRLKIEMPGARDLGSVLQRLRAGYSTSCTLFAITRRDSCFLGASPERLIRVDGSSVRADGLAGSAARGCSAEEDHSLGLDLLRSDKERHEHSLVTCAIRDALEPLCERLTIPRQPVLLRMPNVQHLHTPVEGVLGTGTHILDLVERLHPTPTVGGVPRDAILSRIRESEPFDRGWYAGPVGWIDAHDGGEFAVAIRSALVKGTGTANAPGSLEESCCGSGAGREILMYAGCGIVAGSDPEAEYRESCLKLKAMRGAIEGPSPGYQSPGRPAERVDCARG